MADTVAIADFDSFLCDPGGPPLGIVPCVPQPAPGVLLDTLDEPVMHRLQYRNFGTHETLVGNFTVDVDGADTAGIRWFELRRTPPGAGSWAVVHDGLHSPDSEHRWMGSIAMDGAGNIALGYSVSNATTVFPSIRYTGREAGDPVDTMTGPETTMIAGGGSQTGFDRWGDYSSMNVDPADDCTFWYTNEYYKTTDPFTWSTRIGTFKFSSCGVTVGHFLCYRTRRVRKTPRFLGTQVSLLDQFEDKPFKVRRRPRLLCTPADKNGGGIGDPANHLRSYRIKRATGQPRHDKQKNIKVSNQFGDLFVDTKREFRILVPTLKDLDNPVDLPEPFAPPIDHFKCYKVRITKGKPKFSKQTVTLKDQFITTAKQFLVKRQTTLCTPVDKNGDGILDPDAHLMCYKIRRTSKPKFKKVKGVHVDNQFGPGRVNVKRPTELCVPSTKTP